MSEKKTPLLSDDPKCSKVIMNFEFDQVDNAIFRVILKPIKERESPVDRRNQSIPMSKLPQTQRIGQNTDTLKRRKSLKKFPKKNQSNRAECFNKNLIVNHCFRCSLKVS